MKLHFIFASLLIIAVLLTQSAERSYATHPSEVYWRKMLPETPTPKTAADFVEEKNIYVGVGKGGVVVDIQKPGGLGASVDIEGGVVILDAQKPGAPGTSVGVGKGGVIVDVGKPGESGISVDIGGGGVIVDTGKPGGSGTSVGVGKGGANVDTHQGVPVATSSPRT